MTTAQDIEREHELEIIAGRKKIADQLGFVLRELAKAGRLITEQQSNAIYDVEYAEGYRGDTAASFIIEAMRLTCAAESIAKLIATY